MSQTHRKRILNPSPRLVVSTAVLASLVIVGWLITKQLNAPVHSPVMPSHSVGRKTTLVPPTTPAQNLANNYYSLQLPSGYVARAAETPSAGLLYTQTIIKPSPLGSLIITISVKPLPDGGVASDPSYNLRVTSGSRFSMSSRQVHGDTVQVASDTGEPSVVAFWSHAGLLATISVSSGVGNQSGGETSVLLQALTTVLEAWQWQQ